jgi:hypothetical protein
MNESKPSAGGRAAEAGMSFQSHVGAWFAAHLVSDMPLGSRFGIIPDARPVALQFETGTALDDIECRLTDGCAIYIQCKTRPVLAGAPDSGLARTINQLVQFYIAEAATSLPDPTRVAAVLAVSEDAPRSLDNLEDGCRAFDTGGEWEETLSGLSEPVRDALKIFANHVHIAWQALTGSGPSGSELANLARLFRLRRFGADSTSSDWREASNLVGARLFGREDAGNLPLQTLLGIVRQLMKSGAKTDRAGLIEALRLAGHVDTRAPGFDADIAALRKYTREETGRLVRHTRLPVRGGVPINRDFLGRLGVAIGTGSLLIVGDPGAGKTGTLVGMANHLVLAGGPFVFLSVERLVGLTALGDLRTELAIQNQLIDVLAAWPGVEPGVFIIDALDASRGGPSEAVIASLIEIAVARLGARWSLVASIRTFDLRNGRRFREIMRGAPPDAEFQEPGLNQVRHFRIPALSLQELASLANSAPELAKLVNSSPQKLKVLLQNVFNLSLAAELLDSGVTPESISALSTQSQLIDWYENERLPSQPLIRAVEATVAAMVETRRLTVPQIDVKHDGVDGVLQAGVLVRAGDLVAFAHHVLFDHVAGRFYLKWNHSKLLQQQISGDTAVGLLLGPALRFAIERIWQGDDTARKHSWGFVKAITSSNDLDPVVVSVALRTVAERVEGISDLAGLIELVRFDSDIAAVGGLLTRLSRFVGMLAADKGKILLGPALAWAELAETAASRRERAFVDGSRFLLSALNERADLEEPTAFAAFGRAARALLETAWSLTPEIPSLNVAAIRFVAKGFGSDPTASRALLQLILEEPRFTEHAHEEAPWLSEGIRGIIAHDPGFVSAVYATLFGREAPQTGKTWFGGHRSQILSLTSDSKQDYEHARYHLAGALGPFLNANPRAGVTAVIGASLGFASKNLSSSPNIITVALGNHTLRIVDDLFSLEDWREQDRRARDPEAEVLSTFTKFLESTDATGFRAAVEAAIERETGAVVWARLLGVGAERLGLVDELLWPLVIQPTFVCVRGLARDAIIYLAAAYPARSIDDRKEFERAALDTSQFSEDQKHWWKSLLARFLSVVPLTALATAEMHALRSELEQSERLTGNPAFLSITTSFGPSDRITDSILESAGAELNREPDHSIRVASRALEDVLGADRNDDSANTLVALWNLAESVVRTVDSAVGSEPNVQVSHAAWGAVSNAMERIARSSSYDPALQGHPPLDDLLKLVQRLQSSPFPESREEKDDGLMGWGNWDVRVYAASSLMQLAKRFATERPSILEQLKVCLADPAPTVRLQIVQSLNVLWDIARPAMWTLVSSVAEDEHNASVLGFFIAGPMQRLAGAEPDRTEELLSTILDRLPQGDIAADESVRDTIGEAAGNLVTLFYVKYANPRALNRIEEWTTDLVGRDRYLFAMLHGLREVFFFGYKTAVAPELTVMRDRARGLLHMVVTAAVAAIESAEVPRRDRVGSESRRKNADALLAAGERLLDQSCNQLYFGSGAFRAGGEEDPPGIVDLASKRQFLIDYSTILDLIGQHGSARTIHNLIELYASLADADPSAIFDRIAGIVVGPASQEQYHYEPLGADVLVALVRRYLADYRSIFEDAERRSRLVTLLEVFSAVGWPDALKLLYELPDLLR